ncbi:MAG TPA: tRNA 2-thiouridine(34) synthase MnmA [Candidatus Paceibacterota bacterium]|nr:tRNA 2-thiouridine(34) synthase MnmA [Candidatus Paceibacterota bacterium]
MSKGTVFVGLSGGVDSSVSALRLLKAGYDVVGVFMMTWLPEFLDCDIEAERLDAMRVAATLGIPFRTFDAVEAYREGVANYMIREYEAGRTPNPDVMCNRRVKFGAFFEYAMGEGADYVATGHYARVVKRDSYELHRGKDTEKDQSYFLWTLTERELARTLFPVGGSEKRVVRADAARYSLPTAGKRDSQGICFLGQVDIREFLSHYVPVRPGDVLNERGTVIGRHDGALFYTIGQRTGFTVRTAGREERAHYVVEKNMERNTLTVSDRPRPVSGDRIALSDVNVIGGVLPERAFAEFRYRQRPFPVSLEEAAGDHAMLSVTEAGIDLPSPGQSCVLYDGTRCLGGGIIDRIV